MSLYHFIRPALFRIDPETAHNMALKALKLGLMPLSNEPVQSPTLQTSLWKRNFPNPVGLAAGFDKNAEIIAPMLRAGFGFVEVGTVTPKPQQGNPRPRVFRDPKNEAVINRMGFPNQGFETYKQNLTKFLDKKPRPDGVIGLNIGMNKDQKDPVKDYAFLMTQLAPMADYITINISSPNTPGLRNLQQRDSLMALAETLSDIRRKNCKYDPPPILVKFAPDLDDKQIGEMVGAVLDSDIDGVILTNTTLERPDYLSPDFAAETGGLSGRPLKDKATDIISKFYKLSKGKVPIIGLGGISDGYDAYEKIKAGASLVQIYSALVYHGPDVVHKINRTLLECIQKDGFSSVADAVGADHK